MSTRFAIVAVLAAATVAVTVTAASLGGGTAPFERNAAQGAAALAPIPDGVMANGPSFSPLAATPGLLNFQGRLTDGAGNPVPDSTYSVSFRICDHASNDCTPGQPAEVWNETQPVTTSGGMFNVLLGSVTPLTGAVFDGDPRYLEVKVGTEQPMTPRQRFTTVPYAFFAEEAGNAWSLTGNSGTTAGTNFLGTTDDQPLELHVNGSRALRLEANSSPNLIGGFSGNTVAGGVIGATIGGGGTSGFINQVSANFATVGGGNNNIASGDDATVAGGADNTASGTEAAIGGGLNNTASNVQATVGGGDSNIASGMMATVAGGMWNEAHGTDSTIAGGWDNTITGGTNQAAIGGGWNNTASADQATVGGGQDNSASGQQATVGGGNNNIASNVQATVGGGDDNEASDTHATVGGGYNNTASNASATVGGGELNAAGGDAATVAGGASNTADGSRAAVGGGQSNAASGQQATVGGGYNNAASGSNSTVGGGFQNTASAPTGYGSSTVAGGYSNSASGSGSAVGGGVSNSASAEYAAVGGGSGNAASGLAATVPGGRDNTAAGDDSFAAGRRAKIDAAHDGTFLFADSSDFDFDSATANEFAVRATGGARFVLGIDGSGSPTWTCSVSDGGSWSCSSDRSLKENLLTVDGRDILDRLSGVPVFTWNARGQDDPVRHIGPMAQDFYAAFGVGEDDRHLATIDLDGVALAAIQGLYELAQEKDAQIEAQQQQIAGFEARVDALEQGAGRDRAEALSWAELELGPYGWVWLLLGGLLAGLVLGAGIVSLKVVRGRRA